MTNPDTPPKPTAPEQPADEGLDETACSRLADYLESPPPYRKHCTKEKLWLVLDSHGDSVLWSDQEIAVAAAVEALNEITAKPPRSLAAAPLFGAWFPPETAPRNGTLILGDFGWPWPLLAVWDEYDAQWVVASLQSCPMENGKKNSYIETDTEKGSALKRWTSLPLLPNVQALATRGDDTATAIEDQKS